jgi:hypothetical protein
VRALRGVSLDVMAGGFIALTDRLVGKVDLHEPSRVSGPSDERCVPLPPADRRRSRRWKMQS